MAGGLIARRGRTRKQPGGGVVRGMPRSPRGAALCALWVLGVWHVLDAVRVLPVAGGRRSAWVAAGSSGAVCSCGGACGSQGAHDVSRAGLVQLRRGGDVHMLVRPAEVLAGDASLRHGLHGGLRGQAGRSSGGATHAAGLGCGSSGDGGRRAAVMRLARRSRELGGEPPGASPDARHRAAAAGRGMGALVASWGATSGWAKVAALVGAAGVGGRRGAASRVAQPAGQCEGGAVPSPVSAAGRSHAGQFGRGERDIHHASPGISRRDGSLGGHGGAQPDAGVVPPGGGGGSDGCAPGGGMSGQCGARGGGPVDLGVVPAASVRVDATADAPAPAAVHQRGQRGARLASARARQQRATVPLPLESVSPYKPTIR